MEFICHEKIEGENLRSSARIASLYPTSGLFSSAQFKYQSSTALQVACLLQVASHASCSQGVQARHKHLVLLLVREMTTPLCRRVYLLMQQA